MKRTALVIAVGLAGSLSAPPTAGAAGQPQPEPPQACAMTGTIEFKPSLVDVIPAKKNGAPGKDRKVKVTITGTLTGCAHRPVPNPGEDPATGEFKAKGTLPSRLLSIVIPQPHPTGWPMPHPSNKVKWKAANGKTIGTSRMPEPKPMTWTVTSATTSSFEGTFSDTSKTFPGSPFDVEVVHPTPTPGGSLSFATAPGKGFNVGPRPEPH
jgi:hypothetical protein